MFVIVMFALLIGGEATPVGIVGPGGQPLVMASATECEMVRVIVDEQFGAVARDYATELFGKKLSKVEHRCVSAEDLPKLRQTTGV